MSDDLERAARAIAKQSVTAYADDAIWAEDIDLLRRRDARANGNPLDNPIGAARAALLSFLDMDEAGVERLRLAVKAAFGTLNHEELYEVEADAIARAVLSELRKMAGEK